MTTTKKFLQAAAGVGGEPEGAWDLSYAYYDPPEDLTWNVSAAVYVQSFSVRAQENDPSGVFFKPDGTKMYVLGRNGDDVNEYDLSLAWDVSSASYSQAFSISAQETIPQDIFFKPDGAKMYIIGNNDAVYEYSLSTSWDVSSASYVQGFSVSAQEIAPQGLFFKPDGTKMYVVGAVGDDVNEYDLSTAWDVSSASYLQNFDVSSEDLNPTSISFKPDGTKMYVLGSNGVDVNEYNLSTAWDVSSASYLQNFDVSSQETIVSGLFFKPDGTKMYVVGSSGDSVYEYNIGSFYVGAEDTSVEAVFFEPDGNQMFVVGSSSRAVYMYQSAAGFSVSSQGTAPQGIFFKPDGTKMYVVGASSDAVNEYNLSTAWNLSTATYLQSFDVSNEESGPRAVSFKSDGTKMYVVGTSSDAVNEYNLGTAWDISSASYSQNFSVSSQDTAPQGLFFKSDGTKMYVAGNSSDSVHEYDLSTAWDVSSASFSQSFDVSGQETVPTGVFFKSDGAKMYVVGNASDAVIEYDMSTAWDISSASYSQSFSVSSEEANPQDVFFESNGTKMYVVGSSEDSVYEYNLSTAWDVSTSTLNRIGAWDLGKFTYSGVSFDVSGQELAPQGLFFKSDGTKMYVTGRIGDDVNEYDLSTAWDISSASFSQNFSVSSQETGPEGLFFKPDGTKMYVVGAIGDAVNEYDLSTAWDVSSASFLQSFSVNSQDVIPTGVFFKSDGTKMFVVGFTGDDINEYDLSTAWDISSASYSQNFSIESQATNPTGVFFKPDGTKMFVASISTDSVYTYTLGVQE